VVLKILTYTISDDVLRKLGNRRRNQMFGCMHAHNELTFLNRLLMFTMNPTAEGELHDHAGPWQGFAPDPHTSASA